MRCKEGDILIMVVVRRLFSSCFVFVFCVSVVFVSFVFFSVFSVVFFVLVCSTATANSSSC